MKDLNITIERLLYTEKDIDRVRKYTNKTFHTLLETKLEEICMNWIDKAIEQIEQHEKAKNS